MIGETRSLASGLVVQALVLSAVLLTDEWVQLAVFALFWASTIFVLWALLSRKVWRTAEMLVFASVMAAVLFAVLYSAAALLDPVGLGVPVVGLLFIAGLVCVADKQAVAAAKKPAAVRGSTRFVGLPKKKAAQR